HRRSAHATIFDRARIFYSRRKACLCVLQPRSIDRLEALRFGEDLRWSQVRSVQFVFGKITSSRSKIRTSVAQHIDQLKRHAVTLSQSKHLIFGPARELANVPVTESRPKLTHTTGNQIGVFLEIGSVTQHADLLLIIETLQVEHLATRNFFEHKANVVAVRVLHSVQASQAIG